MRVFVAICSLFTVFLSTAQDLAAVDNGKLYKCYQNVEGIVRDRATNDIMPNTIITLLDEKGNPVETQMVLEDGIFTFKVDCNTNYNLKASREAYTPESRNFTTTNEMAAKLKTKIFLDKGSIDFITASKTIEASEKALANDSRTNEMKVNELKVTAIQNQIESTKDSLQVMVEEEASLLVPKIAVETESTITKHNDDDVEKNDGIALTFAPILFDYESSYLNKKAKADLKKITALLKKNVAMKVDVRAYTDAKGTEKYNQWMSDRRAKRTIDFLVARGISRSRITGKGYGEANLINHCKSDTDCTDEERAVNRRTEFVITQ